MKVLLLGADGQVGFELRSLLAPFAKVDARNRNALDITDFDRLRAAIGTAAPDVIVNAAAYTNVDHAEAEPERAEAVNAGAVQVLADECRTRKIALVHYSTDFVFDGQAAVPYREDAPPNPISAYGQSKLNGELSLRDSALAAVVLRTAWVYSLRRKSFVSTMLRLMRDHEVVRVVDDQVGNPTAAFDLACATALLLFDARRDPYQWLKERRGVYHMAGEGMCSRFELAQAILDLAIEPLKASRVEPIATDAYPLPARRPKYAALDCSQAARVFGLVLPPWRESLARVLGA